MYGRSAADAMGKPVRGLVGASLDLAGIIGAGGVVQARHRRSGGTALVVRVSAAQMDGGYVLVSLPGSMHDRKAFAECGWEELLADTPIIADPAYQGTHAVTPMKKPRGGELSVGNKANNKTVSLIRPAVERCIAHLKNWKILATGYRGRLAELPATLRIVVALEFYRLGW